MRCRSLVHGRYPCGQCICCRINKQMEKALRISHEVQCHKDNVYVTLTYADEHLPPNRSLSKKDVQDFMKRVRKRLGDDRVRYYLSGEYGPETSRPHYHMIIFGLSMYDTRIFKNLHFDPKDQVYRCDCDAWPLGYVVIDKVTEYRMAYVAKYILKKITGEMSKEYYGDRIPEFSLCSRNPGIGYQYAVDHLPRIKADMACTVRGKKRPIPRYYMDKLFSVLDKWNKADQLDKHLDKVFKEEIVPRMMTMSDEAYYQWCKDEDQAYTLRIGQKIQRKEGTKCPIK